MNFLVTGASGFVGSAIARHLLANGHSVRALIRQSHDPSRFAAAGLEPATGDLLDRASLERAVAGMDGVFHAAAIYKFWTRRKSDIFDTNVGGTRSLIEAAKAAGVPRFVFTSSIGVYPSRGRGTVVTETDHAIVDDLPDDYHRSKLLSEELALSSSDTRMEIVVVNPTTPIGEEDVKPTPTGRIVLEYLRHRFPGYLDLEINFVDVRDAAAGHLAAFERGRAGERYILGGTNTTIRGAYGMLNEATGLKRHPIRVPYPIAALAGAVDTFAEGTILRREPRIPYAGVKAARHPLHADSSKAIEELGFAPGPVQDAFGRAARWFASNGYVRVQGISDDPVPEASR